MFAPAEEAAQSVKDWLVSSGIGEDRIMHYDNKGWLAFDASVDEAERLLLTEFHEHEHRHFDKVRVGCDKYERSSFERNEMLIGNLGIMSQSISSPTSSKENQIL
jgi:hypothetical protein